ETPADFPLGDETLSWRTISARWHYAPDPRACWSPASAGLQGPYTTLLSCRGSIAVRARRWPSPLWWQRDRQNGTIAGPVQTPVSLCAGAPGTEACGTACGVSCGQATQWPRVSSGAY